MKIRVYCPYFPHPVTEGAYQVISDQIRSLGKGNDIEVVTWKDSLKALGDKRQDAPSFLKNAKVINWTIQGGDKEGFVARFLRILKSLFSMNPSPAEFYYPQSQDRRNELGPCDLAVYHYSFSWSWKKHGHPVGEKKSVVYLHNLESDLFDLRAQRETYFLARLVHRLNANKLRKQERTLSRGFDELWFISEKDRREYLSRNGPAVQCKTSTRPPTYSEEFRIRRNEEFFAEKIRYTGQGADLPVIGFVGTLDFDPNRASLNWILDHVAPALKQQGWHGIFLVVGRNPSLVMLDKMKQFHFLQYLGAPKDLEAFWARLSLMLVPHIEGSGVRIKLLDSLASGIPTLANRAAVERIDQDVLRSQLLRIEDSPHRWCEVIMSLKGHQLREALMDTKPVPGMNGQDIYADLLM